MLQVIGLPHQVNEQGDPYLGNLYVNQHKFTAKIPSGCYRTSQTTLCDGQGIGGPPKQFFVQRDMRSVYEYMTLDNPQLAYAKE